MKLTNPFKNPEQGFKDRIRYCKVLSDHRFEDNGVNFRVLRFEGWEFILKDGEVYQAEQLAS